MTTRIFSRETNDVKELNTQSSATSETARDAAVGANSLSL